MPDEPAATVVRQIFQWRLEGYSSDGISDKLNQLEVLTPLKYKQQKGLCYQTPFQKSEQASGWSAAIIIRILSNAVYTGVLEQGKTKSFPLMGNYIKKMPKEEWIITEDAHQALVTKACFETIQRILYTDTRCAPGKKLPYPLSGIVKCADCRQNLIRKTTHGYYYYCCVTNLHDKERCGSHRIRCDKLELLVEQELKQRIESIQQMLLKISRKEHLEPTKQKIEILLKAISVLEEKIRKQKYYNSTLEISVQENVIMEDNLHQFRSRYVRKIQNFRQASEKLQSEVNQLRTGAVFRCEWANVFLEHKDSNLMTRERLMLLIKAIYLKQNKNVKIEYMHEKEYCYLRRLLEMH